MAEGPRMTAAQLTDKLLASQHADVLRESVAWMVAELMEAEVAAQAGAELGERTPERVAQRNGYRARAWDTRVGELELAIPRLRTGSSVTSWAVSSSADPTWALETMSSSLARHLGRHAPDDPGHVVGHQ